MISNHGANPIFYNKKNKDWTFKTLAKPSPPTSDNISFLPYPSPHIPPKSQRHMCITPYLTQKDNSTTIHNRNIQLLATELFKVKNELSPPFMNEIFVENPQHYYDLKEKN